MKEQVGAFMRMLIDHHVALTSTLTVFETFAAGRPEAPEGVRTLLSPQLRASYETHWAQVQSSDRGRIFTRSCSILSGSSNNVRAETVSCCDTFGKADTASSRP